MSLNEKLDRVKILMSLSISPEPINEGYREVRELDRLATDIITWYANANASMINRIHKKGFELLYFNEDMVSLKAAANPEDYTILKDFINNSGIYFMLDSEISAKGYFQQFLKKITINTLNNEFVNNLQHQLKHIQSDSETGKINSSDATNILKIAMGVGFRGTIIHELQHAYDSMISDGKYVHDAKSQKYYKTINSQTDDLDSDMSDDERNRYLGLPHEYWARFSEIVNKENFLQLDVHAAVSKFQREFIGWKNINLAGKKRLIKSLYKLYDMERTKI